MPNEPEYAYQRIARMGRLGLLKVSDAEVRRIQRKWEEEREREQWSLLTLGLQMFLLLLLSISAGVADRFFNANLNFIEVGTMFLVAYGVPVAVTLVMMKWREYWPVSLAIMLSLFVCIAVNVHAVYFFGLR